VSSAKPSVTSRSDGEALGVVPSLRRAVSWWRSGWAPKSARCSLRVGLAGDPQPTPDHGRMAPFVVPVTTGANRDRTICTADVMKERGLRSSCPFRARMLGVLTFVRRRRPL
jgi:hypothetical protein